MAEKGMIAHFIELSVFSYPEDDTPLVEKGLLSLLPFDLATEKLKLTKKNVVGFNERNIVIMGIELTKQRHLKQFLTSLASKLSVEQKEQIRQQMDSRIDQEFHFFMRFDKQSLIDYDRLALTDGGNCYHLKITLAPFPRKKDVAFRCVEDFLALSS